MSNKLKIALCSFIGIGILIFLLSLGLRNEVDPLWHETNILLDKKVEFVVDVPDKIDELYNNIHQIKENKSTGSEILSNPFPLTKSYQEWENVVISVLQNKSVLFTSVSGIGASTFLERLTTFIASDNHNIITVKCAPNFELLLHQEYIGYFEKGDFIPGKILIFLEKARLIPSENFVIFIDELDKINPESFWGPYLWDILEKRGDKTKLGNTEVSFPENVFILSTITGTGKSLSNQHFRRIGTIYPLIPSPEELISYLESEKEKFILREDSLSVAYASYLNDRVKLKSFVYSFLKINKIIDDQIGSSFQLGQWSNIRNLYRTTDPISQMIQTYTSHINGLLPEKNIKIDFFDDVNYAIENNGKQAESSPLHRFFDMLEDKGFLTEFVVGLSFITITALSSLIIYRRRGRRLKEQLKKFAMVMHDYDNLKIDHDEVLVKIEEIKKDIDNLTLSRKLNFEEANFLYQFQADKKQEILASKNGVDHFNMLVNTFMEDNVLTLQEFTKLNEFLRKIRPKIGENTFQANLRYIEQLYRTSGEKMT